MSSSSFGSWISLLNNTLDERREVSGKACGFLPVDAMASAVIDDEAGATYSRCRSLHFDWRGEFIHVPGYDHDGDVDSAQLGCGIVVTNAHEGLSPYAGGNLEAFRDNRIQEFRRDSVRQRAHLKLPHESRVNRIRECRHRLRELDDRGVPRFTRERANQDQT